MRVPAYLIKTPLKISREHSWPKRKKSRRTRRSTCLLSLGVEGRVQEEVHLVRGDAQKSLLLRQGSLLHLAVVVVVDVVVIVGWQLFFSQTWEA